MSLYSDQAHCSNKGSQVQWSRYVDYEKSIKLQAVMRQTSNWLTWWLTEAAWRLVPKGWSNNKLGLRVHGWIQESWLDRLNENYKPMLAVQAEVWVLKQLMSKGDQSLTDALYIKEGQSWQASLLSSHGAWDEYTCSQCFQALKKEKLELTFWVGRHLRKLPRHDNESS